METVVPEVSVIVCHHKGDFIYKFVNSVKSSINVTYEIIVVTSDDELALNGIPGCLVVNNYGGPAEKRNVGARLSRAPYLAFFDDDVEIEEYCIVQQVWILKRNSNYAMTYGKLYNMEYRNKFDEAGGYLTKTGFLWSRAGQNEVDKGQYDIYEDILSGKSASCIIDSETFFRVGGFDEDFWILGEETDLAWRVWLSGKKVCWVPFSVAYHAFNTKFKPATEYYTSKRVHYNGCRNYITMLIKNLEARNLWKILPVHILIWFIVATAMLFTGKCKQGFNIIAALMSVCKDIRGVLRKRKEIQEKRVRSDRELWPYIFRASPPRGYYLNRVKRYLKIGLHG